ncbi:MAG: hypothetical protein ACLFNP_08665 [Spirochaetaceae bacterium]
MSDLTVVYCELSLRNPVVLSSSAGVSDAKTARAYAAAGAAAITLAPISDGNAGPAPRSEGSPGERDPEALDYVREIGTRLASERITALISELREELDIPVFASLRCIRRKWWVVYARQAARAGANALELDLSEIDHHGTVRAEQWERRALRVVDAVRSAVSLPIVVKIPYALTSLAAFVHACKDAGARSILLSPDLRRLPIDPKRMERGSKTIIGESDRQGIQYWLAELYRNVRLELAADAVSSGPEAAAAILAGAHAVAYGDIEAGPEGLGTTVRSIQRWMESHTFASIYEARGRLSRWEREKVLESRS